MEYELVTCRYNKHTWEEMCQYREKTKIPYLCGMSIPMSSSILLDIPVFVIEMNNSLNEIMGIGLIRNKYETDKHHKIYSDTNYNRFIYTGKYYLSRVTLENYYSELVDILDEILFKGKTHSKRGGGFTKIPKKVLEYDICKDIDIKSEIRKLFIYHFREESNSHPSAVMVS